MKGKIDVISEMTAKNGRKYLLLEIGGEKYSLWDRKYFNSFKEGDWIEYNFTEFGNYKKITEIKKTNKTNASPHQGNHDETIRTLSLRYAVQLVSSSDLEFDKRFEETIRLAQCFEDYIKNKVPDDEMPF